MPSPRVSRSFQCWWMGPAFLTAAICLPIFSNWFINRRLQSRPKRIFIRSSRISFPQNVRPPAGEGVATGRDAASLGAGRPGVLHGNRTYLLQDENGQIEEAHSISAGLDYPGIGPEHSWLRDSGRVKYHSATDRDALDAFQLMSKIEGIIPALESAHAIAHVMREAPKMSVDQTIVVALSGRGDKDVFSVAAALGEKL